MLTLGLLGQSLTFVSVLTASDVDLSKIVQVVALCRVELNSTSLGQDLSWTRLNTFKPPALYHRIPVPAYERLTKKFTPTYHSTHRRCSNLLDIRK